MSRMIRRLIVVVLSVVGCGGLILISVNILEDVLWPLPPGWGSGGPSFGDARLFVIQRIDSEAKQPQSTCECQILFVPSQQSGMKLVGKGSSSSPLQREGFYTPPLLNYQLRWRLKLDDVTQQVKRVTMSYDPIDQTLKINGKQFNAANGNIFCAFFNNEWDIANISQVDKSLTEQASLVDFKRLLPNEPAVLALMN